MKFIYDDGGRLNAGFVGETNDCAVRSVSIATGIPYKDVYTGINKFAREQILRGKSKNKRRSNSRTGVTRILLNRYLESVGFTWMPTKFVGKGVEVHLREHELPKGRLVVRVSRHFTAVVNGVIHDNHNPQRDGNRCVYGYWIGGIN
jgi:hypothetical protein